MQPMLIDLLVEASLAAPDTRFARLLRRIDRAILLMREAEAQAARQAACSRRPDSQPAKRPSMTTSPEAITRAPAI